nr:transposase [Francisella tularensis]
MIDNVKAWQNRPLESVYPIVFFDCIVVKVREDKCIINIVNPKDICRNVIMSNKNAII